ncbi:unnamed protein product [Schistosoma mattheei]|uniref:Uncharacterized protein n=1 Tax=Schistosoma mattheei TaxID=31246 RepID=A0A183PVS1_9TREM|nr:unnamed protein product [Schistosoma mattheei]
MPKLIPVISSLFTLLVTTSMLSQLALAVAGIGIRKLR